MSDKINDLILIEQKIFNYEEKEHLYEYFNLFNEQIPFLIENLIYFFNFRPLNHKIKINLIKKIYNLIENKEFFKKLLLILGSIESPLIIHKLYINEFYDKNYIKDNLNENINYLFKIYFFDLYQISLIDIQKYLEKKNNIQFQKMLKN